ncbi:hypothetical protein A3860_35180 [Niastella vici]|uniref:Outer membrane protein beta-barrel domain-containing protein n=1 Tax=Niastella vici TaxID=1703345 RepID=A0A1V9FP29_9BACT|nr:hypothetical protein A3860_35180 [Niastella vici]
MYRKTLLALVLIPLTSTAFSQNLPQVTVPDVTDITKVTFHPGLSYEKRIGRYQTLYGQVFPAINFSLDISDGFGGYNSDASFYVDPAVYLQYRFYYNGGKRQRKKKRTELNSMNYIGVVDRTVLSKHPVNSDYDMEKHYRTMNTLGAVWGLQRNFDRSRISIDLNVGPAIAFAKSTYTDPQRPSAKLCI